MTDRLEEWQEQIIRRICGDKPRKVVHFTVPRGVRMNSATLAEMLSAAVECAA